MISLLHQPPDSRSSIYVSLSRSSGCKTIRLLRDFDDEMFLQAHDPKLTDEDERLDQMDVATKEWWDSMQAKGGRDPYVFLHRYHIESLLLW